MDFNTPFRVGAADTDDVTGGPVDVLEDEAATAVDGVYGVDAAAVYEVDKVVDDGLNGGVGKTDVDEVDA